MALALERGLALLDHLSGQPDGLSLTLLADELDMPHSACHRLLVVLQRAGYVRQVQGHGDYVMTTKLVSLGLSYLSGTGIVDIAEPLLERLAHESGELVRLAIVDGDRLTWVAKAQGTRKGLRYDPDMGMDARLSCTASGHAWLSTMSDEQAVALVSQQGFGEAKNYGPRAPATLRELLAYLESARQRGYALIDEVFAPGMAAMAAPVMRSRLAIGVISIAGPRQRLTLQKMQALGPKLLAATGELGPISRASTLVGKPPLGKA